MTQELYLFLLFSMLPSAFKLTENYRSSLKHDFGIHCHGKVSTSNILEHFRAPKSGEQW